MNPSPKAPPYEEAIHMAQPVGMYPNPNPSMAMPMPMQPPLHQQMHQQMHQPMHQPIHQPIHQPMHQTIHQPMPIQYQPQMQQPHMVHTTIIQDVPKCTGCQRPLRTQTEYHSTASTHLLFLLCCVFGLIICAPCVYCMESTRTAEQHCVECDQIVR